MQNTNTLQADPQNLSESAMSRLLETTQVAIFPGVT